MADWENLVGPQTTGTPVVNAFRGKPVEKVEKKAIKDRFEESFSNNSSIWKDLREYETYAAGRMYGACAGPDQVKTKDVLTRFVSMFAHLLQEAYWRADTPINSDILQMLNLAAKVAGGMETQEISILPIKLVAYLNGFCDGYISTCDPESVKNLSYGVS